MIINKLNNLLNNTPHNDINHVIGKYIKKNLNQVGYMTAKDLAEATYVSQAKISKFIKTLGYDDFISFKDECQHITQVKELVRHDQRVHLNLEYKKHVIASIETIKENLLLIDEEMIEKLVDDIFQADEIYLYGVAYSYMLCQYFQYESDFLDKKVIVIDEEVSRDYTMKEHSLLIVLSVDGRSVHLNKREMRRILKLPVKKWLITTNSSQIDEISLFHECLLIPCYQADIKDRRILMRYFIDILIGRFQYLHK